uniref:Si:ch73-212j7.3 n=1 Tax=Amphilophus citrinellus TaxID=61819 RepID=A0A3Q0SRY2_AMPCI
FTNSIKRGSTVQDDTRSLGCPSPRLPSRSGSSLSLCAEAEDRPPRFSSIIGDSAETFGGIDLTMLSPRDDSPFDNDRGIRRRRDSTLSKQDQMLIGKIKSYYENAGTQDATFSLRRRESLTYIPSGLVRSSVSRFNNHMVSSDSLDSLKSRSVQDNLSDDEEFRPSSEMIKIWQAMEQEITKSQSEDGGCDRSKEAPVTSRSIGLSIPTKSSSQESRASDLSTIKEESTSPLPLKPKAPGVNRTGSVRDTLKMFGEEAVILRAPVPRVTQLKVEAEKERPSEDSGQVDEVDKATSKVLHLARQYSQRIRTTKPMARQSILIGKKSLASVVEEKQGKSNLTLPLVSHKQATSLPLSPVDLIRSPTLGLTSSSAGSSRGVSPGRLHSRSPLSPPPPIEGFNWPDVRELRSKYSDHGCSQRSGVSRSRSIPEQFDGSLRRHSSCSSSRSPDDEVANASYGYYIAAEAPLTNDPEHKIIVMEKLPESGETAKEPKEKEDEGYNKTSAASAEQDESQKTRSNSGPKVEGGQQSIVKNLRERFQSMS